MDDIKVTVETVDKETGLRKSRRTVNIGTRLVRGDSGFYAEVKVDRCLAIQIPIRGKWDHVRAAARINELEHEFSSDVIGGLFEGIIANAWKELDDGMKRRK